MPNLAQGEIGVWNDIFESNATADVAIYGSSRAWVHIDPEIIEKHTGLTAYNYGIDGHNFKLQYLRHKLLLQNNPAPKYILVSLDVFTLDQRKDLYNSDQFLPYIFQKDIRAFTSSYEGYSYLEYGVPLIRYIGRKDVVKSALWGVSEGNLKQSKRTKGYLGVHREWNDDFAKARASRDSLQAKFDEQTISLFQQFIEESKELGIQVMFVYTPEYIDGQNFISNRDEVIEKYIQIASQYQIPFLNYSQDSLSYDTQYFYNSLHLNKKGSQLFSEKFGKDLLEIIDVKN